MLDNITINKLITNGNNNKYNFSSQCINKIKGISDNGRNNLIITSNVGNSNGISIKLSTGSNINIQISNTTYSDVEDSSFSSFSDSASEDSNGNELTYEELLKRREVLIMSLKEYYFKDLKEFSYNE